MHVGDVIDGDEGFGVFAVDEVHELLVFAFVDDGDDLVVFFEVIGADRFVDRGAAVQVVDDEPAERLLLLGDDADAALFVVVKDEMVQNDAVEIRAEDAQDHRL